MSSRRCRTTSTPRPIRSTPASARRRCSRRCSSWATSARRPRRASTRRSAATSCASTCEEQATTCRPAQKADEVYGRMLKKPAGERLKLLRESEGAAGPVPVGHPARQLPLRRRASGDHRRERARRRPCDALGLRHEAGPVRAVAGSRLAAGRASGSSEDIDAGEALSQRAAARLGVRRPGGRGRRRAHAEGSWSASRGSSCRSAALPVHARQLFPESVLGATRPRCEHAPARRCTRTKATSASGRSTARC